MMIFAAHNAPDRDALIAAIDAELRETGLAGLGQVRYDDRGAPRCDNHFVSITHTDAKIIVAVSASPVGVDIERTNRKPPRGAGDMRRWTAYEAWAKMRGDGIRLSEVRAGVPDVAARYFDIFDGYTVAVAGGDPDCTVVYLPKR